MQSLLESFLEELDKLQLFSERIDDLSSLTSSAEDNGDECVEFPRECTTNSSSSSNVDISIYDMQVSESASDHRYDYVSIFLTSCVVFYVIYQILKSNGGSPSPPFDEQLSSNSSSLLPSLVPRRRETISMIYFLVNESKKWFIRYHFLTIDRSVYSKLGESLGLTITTAKSLSSDILAHYRAGLHRVKPLHVLVDLSSYFEGRYYRVIVVVWLGLGCFVWCANQPGLASVAPSGPAFTTITTVNSLFWYDKFTAEFENLYQSPDFQSLIFLQTRENGPIFDYAFNKIGPFKEMVNKIPENVDYNAARIGIIVGFLVTMGVLAPCLISGVEAMPIQISFI